MTSNIYCHKFSKKWLTREQFSFIQLIEEGGTQTKFLDASNRFYTLIPHDFGMKKMPMLDTPEIIKVSFCVTSMVSVLDYSGKDLISQVNM